MQQAHGQRARRRIGQQAGVAAEQRLEQAAIGLRIVQLRCQHRRHRGLGPVGQHAQRCRQRLEFLLVRQFARWHVLVRHLQRYREALGGLLAGLNLGVQLAGHGRLGRRRQGPLAAQVAGPVAGLLERPVNLTPGRVDHPGGGLHLHQRVLGQAVEAELAAHVLEEILLIPARAQQARHLRGRQAGMRGHQRRLALRRVRTPGQFARLAALALAAQATLTQEADTGEPFLDNGFDVSHLIFASFGGSHA